MKYVKEFATHAAYENYISDNPVLPNVSMCGDDPYGNNVHFNPVPPKALKFTATGSSTLGMTNNGDNAPSLEYSNDGINWATWDYSALDIADGQSIYIRGNNPAGLSSSDWQCSSFFMTGSLACSGNVMWLIDYENDLTTIPCDYCFYDLFYNCAKLTSAPDLPATTLAGSCYQYMFSGCDSLTVTPALPAMTLTEGCYNQMFYGCISLTAAPELPATTLADYCYYQMFVGCTSLTTAPELPATTLADDCYKNMFNDCSNLNSITMLATNVSASNCLTNWVRNVAATGTFTKKSGVSIPEGVSGIPSGWTVVEV